MSNRKQRQPRLSGALIQWWRVNLARQGLTRTARIFLDEMWEFARDATPARRRQRYGDIEFDCDYRVDTTSATVGLRTHLLGVLAGGPYQPSDPSLFHETIRNLNIDYRQFEFVDLGSGKGRALLMAADYPFRRIIGVELMLEFHNIAQENIRKYASATQRCLALESQLGDATRHEFSSEPTVLFLFNPLPEPGLEAVIANLERSLRARPRTAYVVYHNPILEHVLARSPLLQRVTSNLQFAVYRTA